MKKFKLAIAFGLIFAILFGCYQSFAAECNDISDRVLRLHILANSDTDADQELKLAVRDRILEETSGIFNIQGDLRAAEQNALDNLEFIRQVAQDEVNARGYDYTVQAELTNMLFDTRTYGEITMPSGNYDAVRITIGKAEGHNWWCVLYPPLCIPAAQPKEELSDVLTESEMKVVQSNPKYEVRFAIVEFFQFLKAQLFGDDGGTTAIEESSSSEAISSEG
jgi:stage II sporulation protein R